jgi:predicted amidohydrolase
MFNASFLQFAPSLADSDATIFSLKTLFKKIKYTDLIVLPELTNSGYNFRSKKMAFDSAENIIKSKFLEFLVGTCEEKNIYIVTGFNEKEGRDIYNSSILLGPKGYIGKYRKIHLFLNEKKFFKKGNVGLPVFKTDLCNLGMLICYDWMFPEVWRILALKKADLICHPSNLVLPFAQQAVAAHALINKVYTITANRIGTEGGITFTGKSTICNPFGSILKQADKLKEDIKTVVIDPLISRNKKITKENHIFKDRQIDSYTELIKR